MCILMIRQKEAIFAKLLAVISCTAKNCVTLGFNVSSLQEVGQNKMAKSVQCHHEFSREDH